MRSAESTVPSDSALERALLGCILLDPEKVHRVPGLTRRHFHTPLHAMIWGAMASVAKQGEPPEMVAVRQALAKDGNDVDVSTFAALMDEAGVSPEPLARELHTLFQRRAILNAGQMLQVIARDEPAEFFASTMRMLDRLTEQLGDGEADVHNLREVAIQRAEELAAREPGTRDGVETGLKSVDVQVELPLGELTVIAGRPGMGKSALAYQVLDAVTAGGGVAVYFSPEMKAAAIAERALAAKAQVNLRALKNGTLRDQEWGAVAIAAREMPNMIVCDRGHLTTLDVSAIARQHHAKTPLTAIVVDHLQYLADDHGSDSVRAIGEMTRNLKTLARSLNCAMIVVSQLSRENEKGGKVRPPMMSDLRGSGAIEQDADVILFVHRPEYYDPDDEPGVAHIIVGKQRNGAVGSCRVRWDARVTRFYDA
jgi:replicative DNA helicase